MKQTIGLAYNNAVFGGQQERTDVTRRKELPQTDSVPTSLPATPPPRSRGRTAGLVLLTALAFVAFWIGVRLHVTRLIPVRPNLGSIVTARFFEMGRGCSLLLISPEGKAVLIDTGTTLTEESALKASLRQAGVPALNAVILTSCHAQSIGGLPRLLDTIPVRGPVLIPVPLDQFQARGGRAADLCLDTITRHGLGCVPGQDYLETHPDLLGAATSITCHVIEGNPAEATVIHVQHGRSTMVYLGNVTSTEEESALTLRGMLACDTLVIPPGDGEHAVTPELLALSSAQDVVVPLPQSTEPNPVTLSRLAASDAHLLLMNQSEPVVLALAAQSDTAFPIEAKPMAH